MKLLATTTLVLFLIASCQISAGKVIEIPLAKSRKAPVNSQWLQRTPSVPLINSFTTEYIGPLSIGTPSQEVSLIFDTGSAPLWVFSKAVQDKLLNSTKTYDSTVSSTFVNSGKPFNIEYVKGSCSGTWASESVGIAGLSVSGQGFAKVFNFSADFTERPVSGICGMAPSSPDDVPTLLETLFKQGQIGKRMFGFKLQSAFSVSDGSALYLGDADQMTQYAPKGFTSIPLSATGEWLTDLDGIYIGGTKLSFCGSGSRCLVIFDTGTSLIGVGPRRWKEVGNALISASGRGDCTIAEDAVVTCSSSSTAKLPDVTFRLKGRDWPLHGPSYMLPFNPPILGFMNLGMELHPTYDVIILGDTFLKTFYTVFDLDNKQILLANPPEALDITWVPIVTALIILGALFGFLFGSVWLKHRRLRLAGGAHMPLQERGQVLGSGDGTV